jgi:molybdopterin molybdotransferase
MLTVEQALDQMLEACFVAPIEEAPLTNAYETVLASEVISSLSLPPFDNSAVDGYAVFASDLARACESTPVTLQTIFHQSAGPAAPIDLAHGSTVRVMTGAPIPRGADSIVMQEDVIAIADGYVRFSDPARTGAHIRRIGADVKNGDVVLASGTLIGPAELGILAAVGQSSVSVHRRPRVAILTTGDEIEEVEAGAPLTFGKIYNSNRYCMQALVKRAGCVPAILRHIPDDFEATCSALREVSDTGVEAIICAGGVSVGDRDFVKPAIEQLGRLDLWRVAMKPGKPVAFGVIDNIPFFGLPGNPASVLVTFEMFVRPCLWKMAGRTNLARPQVDSLLMDPIEHESGRREFVRASTVWKDGGYQSTTTGSQASGRMRSLIGSNSFIIISEYRDAVKEGETVPVILTGV